MSYVVRLYCPETDRGGRLNNFERTETQVIRLRRGDYYPLLFKLYTFCADKNRTTIDKLFVPIVHTNSITDSFPIFNTNIVFSYYDPMPYIRHVDWTVYNDDDEVVSEGTIMARYNEIFSIKLPPLEHGSYRLQTSYVHDGDEYTQLFPLVVTS